MLRRPWDGDPRFGYSGAYRARWDWRILALAFGVAVVIVVISAVF
jgi:hypothetical protein